MTEQQMKAKMMDLAKLAAVAAGRAGSFAIEDFEGNARIVEQFLREARHRTAAKNG